MTLIRQCLGAPLVVASDQRAHPDHAVAAGLGDVDAPPLQAREVEHLEVGALDRIGGCVKPLVQLLGTEMVGNLKMLGPGEPPRKGDRFLSDPHNPSLFTRIWYNSQEFAKLLDAGPSEVRSPAMSPLRLCR